MEKPVIQAEPINKPLKDGLVLRGFLKKDLDQLADFFVRVFAEDEGIEPDERVGYWVRDLIQLDDNPNRGRFGFLVEKEETGEIVSALLAIPQTWTYGGLPIPVGQPEPVATDKAYRNRGLVRALFQEFHDISARYGDLVQAITGIPWFYRQFGYEMAVELAGSRSGFITQVETAEKDKLRGVSIRPAQSADIPFLVNLYKSSASRYLLHCPLNKNWWEKEIIQKNPGNLEKTAICILEKSGKGPAGFFIVSKEISDGGVFVRYIEIVEGENWRDYMPFVITESWKLGQEIAKDTGKECSRFIFGLGSQHPAYLAAAEYTPLVRRPYNWYMRVTDLAKFIKNVSPVLEENIRNSPFSGFNEEIKISFYKNDLHLEFQNGEILKAENASASAWHKADVCFPDLTFLQLLFGYRSCSELLAMFVDCRISEKFMPIMDALFPKKPSLILPVE